MSGNKIVIIVLIIIAVLFIIGIGFGVKNDRTPTDNDKKCPKPWIKAFGSLLDPLRPKLKLNSTSFSVSSSKPTSISVPSGKDSFRLATFRLKTGTSAKIEYNPATPGEGKKKLELPRDVCKTDKKDDPRKGSIAIFREGGNILISCSGNATCRIELE